MPELYPLFLYGTLRPGQPLWSWIKESVRGPARVAYTTGYRLYSSETGTYPYMVPTPLGLTARRIVRGTLVQLEMTRDVGQIIMMETKAGYELEQVPIMGSPLGETVALANAFVYPSKYIGYGVPLCDWQDVEGDRLAMLFDWAHHEMRHRLPGVEEVETFPRLNR